MSGFDPADFEEADFDEEAAAALDELDDEGWSDDETTARAGFAFGLTLSMSVFSVTTGQTTTTTILHDVHYHSRWDALDVYCDMATGAEHFELLVLARQKLHVFKLRVDAAGELCNHEGVVGAMLDSDQMVTLAQPPDEDLTVFFSANANFIFVCNTSRVRTLNRHNPGEGALEPSITWEPSEMPALMNPQSGRRVPEGELAEMSCDHEVIAVADIGHHCIFLLDILPGIEGRLALQRTFTGGGHLVSPFAVALSARYLYVLDTAEAADRVVVLDRHTDAVLHVMRFGPCGVSNLRCIAASGPTVIIGDAHMRKCIVMKEAHAARGATSDDCINGSHPESFGLRGHGHGVLAFLESALSHDDGQSPSDWDGPPPDELPVPEESQVLLMELYVHIPSFRDRLWFSLLHLLCENPRMRTFLTIPPRIHDAFWAHERFNLMPYLSGIMDDRRRWQQTTLDKWRKSAPALANKAKGTVSEARWKMSTSLIAKADAVSRFCGVEGSLSDRIEKSLMLCGVRERAAKMNLTQAILLLYHLIYDDESGSLNEVPPIMPAPGFVLLP